MAKNLNDLLNKTAKTLILETLEENGGNRAATARELCVSYKTLRWWLAKFGIGAKP